MWSRNWNSLHNFLVLKAQMTYPRTRHFIFHSLRPFWKQLLTALSWRVRISLPEGKKMLILVIFPALYLHLSSHFTLTMPATPQNIAHVTKLVTPQIRVVLKLRFNSHIMKFTLLRCTVQWFVIYSESCTTITTIELHIYVIPQRNLLPVGIYSAHPLLPQPKQPLLYFLSLWICLFWTFHMNGILWSAALCDQLL